MASESCNKEYSASVSSKRVTVNGKSEGYNALKFYQVLSKMDFDIRLFQNGTKEKSVIYDCFERAITNAAQLTLTEIKATVNKTLGVDLDTDAAGPTSTPPAACAGVPGAGAGSQLD
ncbi:hypothetical protein DID80_06185 [Candidatus Marinamargulisbacteria bacterium SCGC AAA071-K20]|nr:hypothetical protein DID80_06185 [Candidatus Marinamargulisbacteria bacterium SCGC AAA071-K20]